MRTDAKGLLDAGHRARPGACGRTPGPSSTGRTWTATSPTRSRRSTPARCAGRWTSTRPRPAHVPHPRQHGPGRGAVHPGDAGRLAAGRGPGAADGRRFRAERVLRRGACGDPGRSRRRSCPPTSPGWIPKWSRLVTADDATGCRAPGTSSTTAWSRSHGHDAVRPRQPHLVLPVAPVPGPGPARMAGASPSTSWAWASPSAPPSPARFAQRVDDLGAVTDAPRRSPARSSPSGTTGAGRSRWAGRWRHRDQLRGVVLANTAVHQPAGAAAPPLIRLARTPALRQRGVRQRRRRSSRATSALSRPALPVGVRDALAAPYRTAARRRAVDDFVADIPLEPGHPSRATLDGDRRRLARAGRRARAAAVGPARPGVLRPVPARPAAPAAARRGAPLRDGASHLVLEDAPETAGAHVAVDRAPVDEPARPADERPARPAPTAPAAVGRRSTSAPATRRPRWSSSGGRGRTVSFGLLPRRVHELAAGLAARRGAARRPGRAAGAARAPTSTAAVYACWRAGAVIVVADPGLGPAGLARALRGAGPDHVIGVPRGLLLARGAGRARAAGSSPGRSRRRSGGCSARPTGWPSSRALGRGARTARRARRRTPSAPSCSPRAPPGRRRAWCTGTASSRAQLEILRAAFGLTAEDRLVAAFPPFALYGPALGIASAVPDVPAPGRLTAAGAGRRRRRRRRHGRVRLPGRPARRRRHGAALGPGTARRCAGVRLVVSAGAPVPAALLHELRAVLPAARGAHPVRDDRGAAGHRHHAGRRSTPRGRATGCASGRPLARRSRSG